MRMDFKQIYDELKSKRPSFYKYPNPVRVYLHWTGGHGYTTFSDYHFCIDRDGEIINTKPLDEIPSATWHRNTGSIAIALCGCYGAMAYRYDDGSLYAKLGEEAPTDLQIESLAQLMYMISDVFGIPIDENHFMTHAEVAEIDDYDLDSDDPDPRWDLAVLQDEDVWMTGGDILRGKAVFYKNEFEQGK